MANRSAGYGLSAELAEAREAKFDADVASKCFNWIANCLPNEAGIPKQIKSSKEVFNVLHNGEVLCKLINKIKPGSVKKINTSKMAFKQMENIGSFLTACENIGCKKQDLFQTVDLYEGTNIYQVIVGIESLGRKAQAIGFEGPTLGPAESTGNRRHFSERQLRAGQGIIGLQAGSNKGASQAGQNFGKSRSILD